MDLPLPAKRDKMYAAGIPWLEPDSRSRRDVQMESACRLPVENQLFVHFREMKVAPHLDRPVPPVLNYQIHSNHPGIQFDIRCAFGGYDFSGYHLLIE